MTTSLDRVAQSYRVKQAAGAARAGLRVGGYWKGVELGNLDSESNFLSLALPVIKEEWVESTDRAAAFIEDWVGVAPARVPPNEEQIVRSMTYVGPREARKKMWAGDYFTEGLLAEDLAEIRNDRLKSVQGAAVRLSNVGSREMGMSIHEANGTKVAFMRITGSDPCWFCVMLAGRGPVFKEGSFDRSDARFFGPGDVKSHDSCKCVLAAVTRADAEQMDQWKEYEQMWKDMSGEGRKPTDSPLNTFRRNYNQMVRAQS